MDTIIFDGGTAICKKQKAMRDDPEIEFPVESLAEYFNCVVKLKPGTTFRHVWKYLEQDAEFFGQVFSQAMGRFPIYAYVEQGKKPHEPEENEDPDHSMHALEVYWDVGVWEDKFKEFASFHGTGRHKYQDADGNEIVGDCGWAVEFTPVNELMYYPLLLDDKFVIIDEKTHKPIWSGTREWTVYEMYYAILYEITFVGTPDDQVRKMADLDQRVAEAKDAITRGDTYPMDALLDDEDEEKA